MFKTKFRDIETPATNSFYLHASVKTDNWRDTNRKWQKLYNN